MESCHELINLDASCSSTKKVGGVTERIWIGKKSLFLNDGVNGNYLEYNPLYAADEWVLVYNADILKPILGNELAAFDGIRFKNSGGVETTAGENVNTFTQTLTMVLFHHSKESLSKLELLLLNNDMFAIVLTESGDFKCYGFDKIGNNIRDTEGLKTVVGTGADIVELQGEVGVQVQLTATLLSMPFILFGTYDILGVGVDVDIASVTALLDSMCATNV